MRKRKGYKVLVSLASYLLLQHGGAVASAAGGGGGGAVDTAAGAGSPVVMSLRTKTKSGLAGMLPTRPKFPFRRRRPREEALLDTRQRYLHITRDSLVFEIDGEDLCLVFGRGGGGPVVVSVMSKAEAGAAEGSPSLLSSMPVDCIFGVYDLLSGPHVAVVTRSKLRYMHRALGLEFRRASKIKLIPLYSSPVALDEEERRVEANVLDLLKEGFGRLQFYFSHSHDVTHSVQRMVTGADSTGRSSGSGGVESDGERTRGPGMWRESDPRFFWNRGVMGPLTNFSGTAEQGGVVDSWITPVTCAFLQVEKGCSATPDDEDDEKGSTHSFDLLFMSRRSCYRQGTRFMRRGIDEDGNVANFVESEQTLLFDSGRVTSHVQIRGSIPLFWSSPVTLAYHPPVHISEDEAGHRRALSKHAEELLRFYTVAPPSREGAVVFINLVDKKKAQGELGTLLDETINAVQSEERVLDGWSYCPKALRHVWFDFHHECANMQWGNLNKLLDDVEQNLATHGFFLLDSSDGNKLRPTSVQDGVMRTNCMDCLDRTNVVQSLLARCTLLQQLDAVAALDGRGGGEDSAESSPPTGSQEKRRKESVAPTKRAASSGDDSETEEEVPTTLDVATSGLERLQLPNARLEERFRNVWGNNADEISVLYTGTPALKRDFTRTGKRTRLGLMQDGTNSVLRYFINNFLDHRRQEAVDLLVGGYIPTRREDAERLSTTSPLGKELDLDLWARDPSVLAAWRGLGDAAIRSSAGEEGTEEAFTHHSRWPASFEERAVASLQVGKEAAKRKHKPRETRGGGSSFEPQRPKGKSKGEEQAADAPPKLSSAASPVRAAVQAQYRLMSALILLMMLSKGMRCGEVLSPGVLVMLCSLFLLPIVQQLLS